VPHPLYSDVFLDHFRNPRNVGELPPPAITVEASNPVCGDILRLSVVWKDGRVEAASYKARGCTASIAAGSATTELIKGKSRDELAKVTAADIESQAGGLIPESKHVAVLCVDAIRAVCAQK
jgi:nitrogen fixation NifU-like protein